MLDLKFSKKAKKFLSKCEDNLYKRIVLKINELCENPFPNDCKRVINRKEKCFRIRVGNYRIVYVVVGQILFVADIDKRARVYG